MPPGIQDCFAIKYFFTWTVAQAKKDKLGIGIGLVQALFWTLVNDTQECYPWTQATFPLNTDEIPKGLKDNTEDFSPSESFFNPSGSPVFGKLHKPLDHKL